MISTATNPSSCSCASSICTTCCNVCASPTRAARSILGWRTWSACPPVRGGGDESLLLRRRFFTYRIARGIPVTTSRHAVSGPVGESGSTTKQASCEYHNAWFTDLEVDATNVAVVVRIGRSRWKIEKRASLMSQKNHGYELEHNYGHGQQTLAMVFYLLDLLAFVAHVILERGDRRYRRSLATTSRRELWHTFRTTMAMISGCRVGRSFC